MTDKQAFIIASALLIAGGVIATAVGVVALAVDSDSAGGPVPGAVAIVVGLVLGWKTLTGPRED